MHYSTPNRRILFVSTLQKANFCVLAALTNLRANSLSAQTVSPASSVEDGSANRFTVTSEAITMYHLYPLLRMLVFVLCLSSTVMAHPSPRAYTSIGNKIGGYLEFLPDNYATSNQKYPVLIFTANDQVQVGVAAEPTAGCGCDHIITSAQPYVNGNNLNVQPGDVICIQAGNYPYLNLFNFKGTADQPLLFKNCGGQVRIGGSEINYGIVMNNNRYFRFTGTGSSNYTYGFRVDGQTKFLSSGFGVGNKSSDFKLDHVEITKVGAGVLAKTSPSCDPSTWNGNYVMRNVKFHDFYIHNIKGEGFYIGHTSLKVKLTCNNTTQEVVPHDIKNIRVYDNIIEHAGWDGIQVSRASENCEIYNNRVYDYGTENKSSQQGGILVGGASTGKVYNNWVEKGTGSGIQVFGTGQVTVYNNVVVEAGEDAVFCDDRSPHPLSLRLINNTLVAPVRDGVRLYSDEGINHVIQNNLIVAPGSLGDYGNRSYLFILNNGVDYDAITNYFAPTTADAGFVDATADDFQLRASSAAVNKGSDASQYGITTDYRGAPRPRGGAYDIGAYESDATPPPVSQTVWLEAECAAVASSGSFWTQRSDTNASGGRLLEANTAYDGGTGILFADPRRQVQFTFTLSQAGNYHLLARHTLPSGNGSAFVVKVNEGSWQNWNTSQSGSLAWQQVLGKTFALSAGQNTITFVNRNLGAQLDKLAISLAGALPSGKGSTATNCANSLRSATQLDKASRKTEGISLFPELEVYPNPSDHSTTLRFTQSQPLGSIWLTDLSGKVIRHWEQALAEGTGELRIDTHDIPAGYYLLRGDTPALRPIKLFIEH